MFIKSKFLKKFNPSDYEIKGFTNPYKPDLSARPQEPTVPMNPDLYRKPKKFQKINIKLHITCS